MPTYRPLTMSVNGMVVSPHYLASQAGLAILRAGGNAVDAAIATDAMLNVVYPHCCGTGGDAFWLIYRASSRALVALNGSGRAPAAATVEAFAARGYTSVPLRGLWPVTIPGVVQSWHDAMQAHGTLGLAAVLAPAIEVAEQGYPVCPSLAQAIAVMQETFRAWPTSAAIYLPNGRVPAAGDLLTNPHLARTLRQIGRQGADVFYRGEVAQAMAMFSQANDGLFTAEDLAGHTSTWVTPLSIDYHGVQVCGFPPNSQGLTALLGLNILEGFDLAQRDYLGADYLHLSIEAKKLAFADRDRYLADPDAVAVPTTRLLDKAYAAQRRTLIDPLRAGGYPTPGSGLAMGADTIYLATADRFGNAVSLIQSNYMGFGSGVVAGETGVMLHNRGAYFSLNPAHVNCIAPHKRPLHTLMPAAFLRDGRLLGVFGTMGGDGQAQTHMQVITGLLDSGRDMQSAIEAPRWYSICANQPGDPRTLTIEDRVPAQTVAELRARGHIVHLTDALDAQMGHAHGIWVNHSTGVYTGGSDPRADGIAAAW